MVIVFSMDTQLYKRLCPSVRPSVRWSVGPSARVEKWVNAHIRPCPPVRIWWPCIRPCFLSSSKAAYLKWSSLLQTKVYLRVFIYDIPSNHGRFLVGVLGCVSSEDEKRVCTCDTQI